jgi:gliding motility-associated-like protein/uncharacterized repeat protein (TIGR01451 family)
VVPSTDDNIAELTETFELTATVTSGNTANASATGTGTILDDDAPSTPSISITNDADRPIYGAIGEVITYSYVVTNNGDVTLTNVIVTDPLTGTVTNVGTLEPGASATITGNYTVTQEDLIRGFIENTATATGTAPDNSTVTNNDDERVDAAFSPIVANDDRVEGINGADGGKGVINVFENDSLKGRPVSPQEVILTIVKGNEYLVLNPDGSLDVKPGTPAGSYELIYQICEVANPGNCQSATVTVTVTAPTIEARDNSFGSFPVSYGGLVGNILGDDSLNGRPLNPEDVNYEILDLDGLQGLIIYPNGDIELLPGVNPPGVYVLTYRICERNNPTNCDTATITITLVADQVDLAVTKTSFGVEIFEGDEFEYEVVVRNLGGTNATDVRVTDELPVGVSYLSSTIVSNTSNLNISTAVNGSVITWTLTAFPADATFTIRLRVRADDLGGDTQKSISNVVKVIASEEDKNPLDNVATDVNLIKPFFIPNVITPNGDGINDLWRIKGLNKFESNRVIIFNRWGDHLYERENYQNDWAATGIVSGTYYYILWTKDKSGKEQEFKGWIQVIKESIK